MNIRVQFSAILFTLAATFAGAQTAAPPATPKAAEEVPADRAAFQAALKIDDPRKKIEALEKFKKDFPTSTLAASSTMNVFSTLVQRLPAQTARIQQVADSAYRTAEKKDKGSMAGQFASTLLSANLLLHDAERYARKSLESMDQADYLKTQKAAYEKRKAAAPSDEELIKRFKQSRANRVALLGRVEFKLGKNAAAEKLLEESNAVSPNVPEVTGTLGELALKSGNESKGLDLLLNARLSGKAPATSVAALESVYRKNHSGSLDGYEAMLDAEYRKRFPNPVKAEAFKPMEDRSDRLVLAEVFTGAGCAPCLGADLAFDAAMERYGSKNLAVVMYHQHIPLPDPMTNPAGQARFKSYKPIGVPTYRIDGAMAMCVSDGKPEECNGAGRDGIKDIYGHVQIAVDRELVAPAEAQIKLQAALEGNAVKVTAAVSGVKSASKDLNVQVLLLEKEQVYSGENGIRFHPMVVRAMGGEKEDGFAMKSGAGTFNQTFDVAKISAALKTYLDEYELHPTRGNPFQFAEKRYQIDAHDLAVVVFVQDVKTKHVLQSAFFDLNPKSETHPATDAPAGER